LNKQKAGVNFRLASGESCTIVMARKSTYG